MHTTAQSSPSSAFMLYEGDVSAQDIFDDINNGFRHFFQAGHDFPLKDFRNYEFSLTLSPRVYYTCPIVEVINYYLVKFNHKALSSMSLTALHEAISNSLLWGLLKVVRPDNWLDFGQVVEERLEEIEKTQQTLSLAISIKEHVTVHIMNPYDDDFNLGIYTSDTSLFPRGVDLIHLFSDISYNKDNKTLSLTFKEDKDVLETIYQPQ